MFFVRMLPTTYAENFSAAAQQMQFLASANFILVSGENLIQGNPPRCRSRYRYRNTIQSGAGFPKKTSSRHCSNFSRRPQT